MPLRTGVCLRKVRYASGTEVYGLKATTAHAANLIVAEGEARGKEVERSAVALHGRPYAARLRTPAFPNCPEPWPGIPASRERLCHAEAQLALGWQRHRLPCLRKHSPAGEKNKQKFYRWHRKASLAASALKARNKGSATSKAARRL